MSTLPSLSPEEVERLKERIRVLAQDKSYFQLIINLMSKVSAAQGLDNMIEILLSNILGIIGGTNIILYYLIDKDLHYADIFGKRMKLDRIDDALVQQVFENQEPIEQEQEFSATGLLTPEFTKAYTWVLPLMTGRELVGVFKLENLHLDMRDLYAKLPVFFSHVASVLKNEVQGQTRLKQAYDELRQINAELAVQINTRKEAEDALRLAKDHLQERVIERTVELYNTNSQLRNELEERKKAEEALRQALDHIKTLRGIVPICMICKKIRDDRGYWNQVEVYVREHTEAEFSHGLCPECEQELYPETKEGEDGSGPRFTEGTQ